MGTFSIAPAMSIAKDGTVALMARLVRSHTAVRYVPASMLVISVKVDISSSDKEKTSLPYPCPQS